MKPSPNVLITSSGRRGQLLNAFAEVAAQRGGKVFTADCSRLAPTAHLSARHFEVPPIHDDAYVETLVTACRDYNVSLVVPTIDTELRVLSAARPQFSAVGSTVLISDSATIGIAADKRVTNRWLIENAFPTPAQFGDLPTAASDPALPFPVFAKPATGSRSQGAQIIGSRSALKQLDSTIDWLIEEHVRGTEFTVSTYVARDGHCVAAVPRERIEVRDGEVSKAVTRKSARIQRLASSVVERLPGAWGPLNIQVMLSEDRSTLSILEINARFGGGDPLAWQVGANAPLWAVREAIGEPIEPVAEWAANVAMLRLDTAVFAKLPLELD